MNLATSIPDGFRSGTLVDFKRLAYGLDLDPVALVNRAGIDPRHLDDPDVPLSIRAVVELLELTARTTGIDDFGLRLGIARGLPDLGPVILVLREVETVRDALKTLVALLHLHSDITYMHIEDGEDPFFAVDVVLRDVGQCRQAVDLSLAGVVHILRWLLGENWKPVSAAFTHTRPASTAHFERFFRCPIDWLHEYNGIVLERGDLDHRLPPSSPALQRQVQRYIRSINIVVDDAFVHQVTCAIATALARGEARASIVAHHLGTDRRALNRRLARAGLNYSAVVQTVRKNLAVQYILGSERPLWDIACLLGFGSLTTFGRWFRGSFGVQPSVWRKAQQANQDS